MRDQLTQSDIDKMQQEIEYRKLVKRPELLEAVKETRAHGDLSENFEYHAAKKEKNKNQSVQIAEIIFLTGFKAQ